MMLLSRVPSPLDKGDKLRAYQQIKGLSKHFSIYLFCLTDHPVSFDMREHLLQFCSEVNIYPAGHVKGLLQAARGIVTGRPFQAEYFYNTETHRLLLQAAERIQPDGIFVQLVRMALYQNGLKGMKVLDYMDAFSKGYERMADKATGIERWLLANEADRLKKFETEVFPLFNKHTIISEQDRRLIATPGNQPITVVPNGVDATYFSPVESPKKFDLVFHGNMNYPPNIDAALYIANHILPEMDRRGLQLSLLVSGASPHPKVKRLHRHGRITVTGWVDDVRSSYYLSKIFLAPLQIGTGMQNKVLEAMAMGIPCVASPLVANALGLENNRQVIIANSVAEYGNAVENLLANSELYNHISEQALQHVRTNFKWSDSWAKLQTLISS